MTRVEKYRAYRKEILNSFYVEKKETKKVKSAEIASKITINRDAINDVSYDEVLEAYDELYDEKQIQNKKHHLNQYQKRQISFIIICVSIIILLLVAFIIVGILAFGG